MSEIIRETAETFVAAWAANKAKLEAAHAYNPADEHDTCGVGLVASIDGTPQRRVVEAGITALSNLMHRGAVDADGKTGDGAGIHLQIPKDFFREHIERTGRRIAEGSELAVGQVFLPRNDCGAQELCRSIVESEILELGYTIYGWRQVPVNTRAIGEKAAATRPEIEQIMIANGKGNGTVAFERDLYLIRRRIEKKVREASVADFYMCSLSSRSIIYKVMLLGEQLTVFYPDLLDERFVSNFVVYHQRYSTNTFPTWSLAQPFRMLAHNGEINTVRGNRNWMKSHEALMASEVFGPAGEDIKPLIPQGSSDSGALDAVFEALCHAGRSAPLVKLMLMPPAWSKVPDVPEAHRSLYAYLNTIMEPWDGPAALAIYDGRWIAAGMDRNGLRPMRYAITACGLLLVGSEAGMVPLTDQDVIEKGRVGPGEFLGVDLQEGKLYHDLALKDLLAAEHDYASWAGKTTWLGSLIDQVPTPTSQPRFNADELRRRQLAVGLTIEDLELILHPMAEEGKEAVGSMGDDAPVAVLSSHYRGLHNFFRQEFSQVTNPPIDPLREEMVMTLDTRLGNLGNVFAQDESQMKILLLDSPIVTNRAYMAMRRYMKDRSVEIDCTMPAGGGDGVLKKALERIRREAEDAVRGGAEHIILTDERLDEANVAVPMILAAGGVHTYLVQQKLRTFCSVNVQSAECLDVQYMAVLVGVGATTINAYLTEEAIYDRHRRGLFGDLTVDEAVSNFKHAADLGLLKVLSKMGISVISSYRGAYNFEAVGLSRSLVAEFFPGMSSRISGIGLAGIERKTIRQHERGFQGGASILPIGGFYRYRAKGEAHGHDGRLIHMLQAAVASDSYTLYKKYSEGVRALPLIHLRDLLDFKTNRKPVPVDEVESITSIRKRFETPAMSLGALSAEAHETLTIAMNRIGAHSNSGEGGESCDRFQLRPNGDNANSGTKQVASGRFGVTTEYLNNCREIQIKVAQGAKPGEGGQLPAFKVTVEIAKLRHSMSGVMLISPPPHHDIYSIEDLAQLIYDLKQVNPDAEVSVKLVARSGIGTIAAGVAKANADVIVISGHNGGTGASPQTSIKYAGVPWEMGLSEANQVLTLNRLRHRVRLRTDGGLKTGRDVIIAAMLGAEEFGIGTASLLAMGCIMVRQCHSNTCPVGVCTQDPALRAKFDGTPEKVVNLFTFISEEVREILAQLGAWSLNEIIGRSDLLSQVSRGSAHLDDLDLNSILAQADPGDLLRYFSLPSRRNPVPDTLDAQMIVDAAPALNEGEKMQLTYNVRNTHRSVGTRLSSKIVRRFGMDGLQPGHITVRLRGSAGQSLGAFAVQGMKLEVIGDSNDYVGKGLSGGSIVVRPPFVTTRKSNENVIIGNTVLYGAISGELFAAGQAGERFCVRNSGAQALVEGCGANGCEYMTGGTVVILGKVGHNFGAGMTGGMAFILDSDGSFERRVNPETLVWQRIATPHWEALLRGLIERHVDETKSTFAQNLLDDWERTLDRIWQVVPKEMVAHLEHPLNPEEVAAVTAEAGGPQRGLPRGLHAPI